jgi:hypothetical protein
LPRKFAAEIRDENGKRRKYFPLAKYLMLWAPHSCFEDPHIYVTPYGSRTPNDPRGESSGLVYASPVGAKSMWSNVHSVAEILSRPASPIDVAPKLIVLRKVVAAGTA